MSLVSPVYQQIRPDAIERDSIEFMQNFVSSTLAEFVSADADKRMTKSDFDAASAKQTGARENVLIKIAERAHKADWSESDIKLVIDAIIKSYKGNDDKKATSIATFKSEILTATHHKVRGQVATIFRVTREAFEAETEAAKSLKTRIEKTAASPIRKAFSRAYHTAIAAFKAIPKSSNLVIATPEDVTTLAVNYLRGRRFDAKLVKARLDAIRAELEAFHDDYEEDGIGMCLEYLKAITEGELKAAHEAVQRKRNAALEADEPETVIPDAPEVSEEPVSVADALDDALDNIYGAKAA